MRIPKAFTGCLALACFLTTGCYNNPHTSDLKPGEGTGNIHGRPAVGPGTTAGGSTAGPQTAKPEPGGHAQPTASGSVPAHPDLGHATAAQPQVQHGAETPKGPASESGNEKGGDDRGPAPHADRKH